MSLIKYSDTPRAAFGLDSDLNANVLRDIPSKLAAHLGKRFDASSAKKRSRGTWTVDIKTETGSVKVMLARSEFEKNEWRLMAGSWRIPSYYILAKNKPQRYDAALLEVCREIHYLLSHTPSVRNIRWYFEGSDRQTEAVLTPDDMPWHDS